MKIVVMLCDSLIPLPANHMANNQPFFMHLAKQTTTVESGG